MQNADFEYEQNNNGGITILKYIGGDTIADVPEIIMGLPVTEIAAYAFSGLSELEEIHFPKTLRKIGRYAFYQCHSLRKFVFFSRILDVGAGAFTGCRKIRELEVTVLDSGKSCLKEFLSDIRFEVTVVQHGAEEGKFLFPEFFEEAVENTPARIIVTDTHGSGVQYRNCLRNTGIDVKEYDRLFLFAEANEFPDFMVRMSLARMEYPEGMQDEAKKRYHDYIRGHLKEAAKEVLKTEGTAKLHWFAETFVEAHEEMKILLDLAGEKRDPEKNSFLMDYQHRRFPAKRKKYQL